MSIRYGIMVIPEPAFTARAYRARQLVCGQYGAWAAEMHLLHLAVAAYFPCPEAGIESVDAGLAIISEASRRRTPGFALAHRGVAAFPEGGSHICLDFSGPQQAEDLSLLYRDVVALLQRVPGAAPGVPAAPGAYRPHIPLMQHARLPPEVFASAVEFSRAVVEDLGLPAATQAWRLVLVRFRSEAAGDDWGGGRWAADLRWELLSSYPL